LEVNENEGYSRPHTSTPSDAQPLQGEVASPVAGTVGKPSYSSEMSFPVWSGRNAADTRPTQRTVATRGAGPPAITEAARSGANQKSLSASNAVGRDGPPGAHGYTRHKRNPRLPSESSFTTGAVCQRRAAVSRSVRSRSLCTFVASTRRACPSSTAGCPTLDASVILHASSPEETRSPVPAWWFAFITITPSTAEQVGVLSAIASTIRGDPPMGVDADSLFEFHRPCNRACRVEQGVEVVHLAIYVNDAREFTPAISRETLTISPCSLIAYATLCAHSATPQHHPRNPRHLRPSQRCAPCY
jgi:hypothetical protein